MADTKNTAQQDDSQGKPAKAKAKTPRQPMPEQAPEDRAHNFMEVPFGYDAETAMLEASRCLECKRPRCVEGCPVNVDIPGFIGLVKQGRFLEAAQHLKQQNALPAVCGRVCPQEEQCESKCVLGLKGEPVAIGRLERFVADYERNSGEITPAAIAREEWEESRLYRGRARQPDRCRGSYPAGL